MPLEPIDQLAFAIQQYKGQFALLIGSGVSRSAGIATGWEIVLDLIRRQAVAAGEVNLRDQDLPDWYHRTFNEAPDYSLVVKRVAPSRHQRAHILRQFFEPTDQEIADGMKQPQPAHRAIAKLVRFGFIKVIITTNFDRLLERALAESGVEPAIIGTEDAAKNMAPLQHLDCVVFKVHGDYLDTRIRNVTDELDRYPSQIRKLLDRIIADHGLIVCGWSGEWDRALGDAIIGNTHQRLPTFWMSRSEPRGLGREVFREARAIRVSIENADEGFCRLADRVLSIDSAKARHPDSADLAIALTKKLLANQGRRIELNDFVLTELSKVKAKLTPERFQIDGTVPLTRENYLRREAEYLSLSATLAQIAATCAKWGTSDLGQALSLRIVSSLGQTPQPNPMMNGWYELQSYPASLAFYAAGIAALVDRNFSFLRKMLEVLQFDRIGHRPHPAIDELRAWRVFSGQPNIPQWLDVVRGSIRTKPSWWMHRQLHDLVTPVIGTDLNYDHWFDLFELLIATVGQSQGTTVYGKFMEQWLEDPGNTFERFDQFQLASGALEAGMFGNDHRILEGAIEAIKDLSERAHL